MATVAEGEMLGFTAAAGPDGAAFVHFHRTGSFAGALMGSVAKRRVFGLSAETEVEGLAGLSVDLVGEGLPVHGVIIRQA